MAFAHVPLNVVTSLFIDDPCYVDSHPYLSYEIRETEIFPSTPCNAQSPHDSALKIDRFYLRHFKPTHVSPTRGNQVVFLFDNVNENRMKNTKTAIYGLSSLPFKFNLLLNLETVLFCKMSFPSTLGLHDGCHRPISTSRSKCLNLRFPCIHQKRVVHRVK